MARCRERKYAQAIAPLRRDVGLPLRYASRLVESPSFMQMRETDGVPNAETMIELLEVKGDYAEALFYERKALELYQKLSADSPQDVHARYRTAVVGATAAKLEAWLADREQALGGCATVLKVLKELPEDQANNLYSGLRGQAYLHVGAAQAALAAAKELTATQQHEYWRVARDLYRRSLDIWQDMQKRGSLTVELSTKLQEARRGLDKCDAVLAEKTTRR